MAFRSRSFSMSPFISRRAQQEAARRRAMKQADQAQMNMLKDQGYTTLGGIQNKYGISTPMYTMMRDEQGNLQDRFQEGLSESLQGLKDKFGGEGPTKWAQMQQQKIADRYGQGVGQAQQQAATAQAQTLENLAMRGGQQAGARERMGMMGNMNLMNQMQGLGKQQAQQGLDLAIQDEQMKNQMMQSIGQQEQGISGRNIGRLQQDIQGQNLFLSNKYKDEMAAYGSEQTAKAQRKASKGGSFTIICTYLHDKGDITDETFENTQRNGLEVKKNDRFTYNAYIFTASKILDKAKKYKAVDKFVRWFFKPCVEHFGGIENAKGEFILNNFLKVCRLNYKIYKFIKSFESKPYKNY